MLKYQFVKFVKMLSFMLSSRHASIPTLQCGVIIYQVVL